MDAVPALRVLQVITSTDRRGAEVAALDLAAALRRRGVDVRTVALSPRLAASVAGDEDGATLDVPCLGDRPLGVTTLRRLRAEAAATGVVVANGSKTLPACALALVGTRVPFVYRNIGDPTYWASSWTRRIRVRAALRRAAAVVSLWSGAADAISSRYGIPRDRVRVIPNGVDSDRFPAADANRRAEARQRLGIADDTAPVVVVLGALTSEKNVEAATRAVHALGDERARLVVAGEGPCRAALESEARRVLGDRVRFLGTTDDPASVLAAADVVALPSRSEGIPAVAIEAALTGVPVVASAVGGLPDVIEDGVTGYLVPAGDDVALTEGIRRALEAADDVGLAARAKALAAYDVHVVAAAWLELLRSVAAN